MASLPTHTSPFGVDLNIPSNLALRDELVKFQYDTLWSEIRFSVSNIDKITQRTLQLLAHSLDLNYEYSVSANEVRITRSSGSTTQPASSQFFDFDPVGAGHNPEDTSYFDDTDFFNSIDFGSNTGPANHDLATTIEPDFLSIDNMPEFPVTNIQQDFLALNLADISNKSAQGDFGGNFSESLSSEVNEDPWKAPRPLTAEEEQPADRLIRLLKATQDSPMTPSSDSMFSGSLGSRAGSIAGSRSGSRAASISSNQSNSSRNRISKSFSRRNSFQRRHSSVGYQEIVFESTPSRPESRASVSSGRMGPLGSVARAAMKAVKAVGGACWRCRILRKQCDSDIPCNACPKSLLPVPWRLVGCRRGCLKDHTSPLPFCPQNSSTDDSSAVSSILDSMRATMKAMRTHTQLLDERKKDIAIMNDRWLANMAQDPGQDSEDSFLSKLEFSWPQLRNTQTIKLPAFHEPLPPNLTPLDECIEMIVWHACRPRINLSISGDNLILLRAAAIHQAKTDSDQLISQSLVCLRICYEAIAIQTNIEQELLNKLHVNCKESVCENEWLADLTSALDSYVDELSRTFFKKENMRTKSWWLSVFYSLCIQSMVRKALIKLLSMTLTDITAAQDYLQIAVRLFISISGTYDPLADWPARIPDYESAQKAIQRDLWSIWGVRSSFDYIKELFKDNGDILDNGKVPEANSRLPNRVYDDEAEG